MQGLVPYTRFVTSPCQFVLYCGDTLLYPLANVKPFVREEE